MAGCARYKHSVLYIYITMSLCVTLDVVNFVNHVVIVWWKYHYSEFMRYLEGMHMQPYEIMDWMRTWAQMKTWTSARTTRLLHKRITIMK